MSIDFLLCNVKNYQFLTISKKILILNLKFPNMTSLSKMVFTIIDKKFKKF